MKLSHNTCIVILLFAVQTNLAQQIDYDLDQTYDLPENGTIELRSNDADVTITGSDRDQVRLVVRKRVSSVGISKGESTFKIDVETKGDRLIISEKRQSNKITWGYRTEKEYTITLEVPEGVSLELIGDDDDYLVTHIRGQIKLVAEDGDARFEDCTGNDFDFTLDDGELYLQSGAGKLSFRGQDGGIIVEEGDFQEVYISMDDGDIDLTTALDSRGTYELVNEDGQVELNITRGGGEFTIRRDDGRLRADGNFRVLEDDEHYSVYRLPGGDAKVNIKADDASIVLHSSEL